MASLRAICARPTHSQRPSAAPSRSKPAMWRSTFMRRSVTCMFDAGDRGGLADKLAQQEKRIAECEDELKGLPMDDPHRATLREKMVQLYRAYNNLFERAAEAAPSADAPAGKAVTIALPHLDAEGNETVRLAQERVFHSEEMWREFLERRQLEAVVEDSTGQEVEFYRDLNQGGVYTGVLRASSGAYSTHIITDAHEFELALRQLVAMEERVSLADVELLTDVVQQIHDNKVLRDQCSIGVVDALVRVRKGEEVIYWIGGHTRTAADFTPVSELLTAAEHLAAMAQDPKQYPMAQAFMGVTHFKKALYAEYTSFKRACDYLDYKNKCDDAGVMLLRQAGSRLVRA